MSAPNRPAGGPGHGAVPRFPVIDLSTGPTGLMVAVLLARRSWRREHQNLKTTQGIGQLTALIKTRLKQMQYRPGLIT